jgi:hypothetical protein
VGAAYWSGLPSPMYQAQASMLPSRSQIPTSTISLLDAVVFVSSIMG